MKNANRQLKEELIRKAEAAYDHAWQEGNVDGLVTCLTKDAVLINPRGEVAIGHDEIRKHLGEFLAGPARGSKHTSHLTRISFVTDDVAVVDGEALVEGVDFDGSSTVMHLFTDILVRSGNDWLIAQIRAYANY